ncbi:MAG: hypothetical protein IJF59_03305, partial [Clostridia bacterium]|nr:hypothetical protein [Clostridia bacterium]
MSSLFHSLPSFAPDYSGFFGALHGLDALLVLHDPSGCLGNYISCDEPRWYHDPRPVFTSLLKEMEAVTGDDEKLVRKVVREAERFSPPFICLLTTPVPSLIGFDPNAVALRIEQETGIPTYGIDTTGFPTYENGLARAMAFLADHIMLPKVEKKGNSVNILGMTPLDYFIGGEREKLGALIESLGFTVNARIGGGDSLEEIQNARAASHNLVMASAALPLARRIEEEDGIPWFAGPPCGDAGVAALTAFLRGEAVSNAVSGGERTALVVAEQGIGNAVRRHPRRASGRRTSRPRPASPR